MSNVERSARVGEGSESRFVEGECGGRARVILPALELLYVASLIWSRQMLSVVPLRATWRRSGLEHP